MIESFNEFVLEFEYIVNKLFVPIDSLAQEKRESIKGHRGTVFVDTNSTAGTFILSADEGHRTLWVDTCS